MRQGLVCFALCILMATPAAADWRFRWGGTSAGVWATNEDGTSLALSCDRRAEGRMRVEYTVTPAEGATGDAGIAVFNIDGQTTEVPVEAYVPSGGRLQIMRSDLPYADPEIEELRASEWRQFREPRRANRLRERAILAAGQQQSPCPDGRGLRADLGAPLTRSATGASWVASTQCAGRFTYPQ